MVTADQAQATRTTDIQNLQNENTQLGNFTQSYEQSNPFSFNQNDPYISAARTLLQSNQAGEMQNVGRQLAQTGQTSSGAAQKAVIGVGQANQTQLLGIEGQQYNTQMNQYLNQMQDIYSQKAASMNFSNALSEQQYNDAVDTYYKQMAVDTSNATLQYQREQEQQQNSSGLLGGLLGGIGGIVGTIADPLGGGAIGSAFGSGLGKLLGSL